MVVDLAGGWTAVDKMEPWRHDTLVNSFSVGKGVLGILLAMSTTSGGIQPDSPTGLLWQELNDHGVGALTLREVSGHRAGLVALSDRIAPADLYDWTTMTTALAKQQPWWRPGTAHGYHVNTFGFLLGELLSRARDRPPQDLLGPLRDFVGDGMYFGVPSHQHHRIADLYWQQPTRPGQDEHPDDRSDHEENQAMDILAYRNPPNFSGVGAVNTSDWRRSVHPSTSMHASARGVEAAFHTLLEPGIVAQTVLAEASRTVSDGQDVVLGSRTRFGTAFQLPTESRRFGPSDNAVGHYGAGGSVGFCDPDNRLSLGYVSNTMGVGWQNERNQDIIAALYGCL